MGGSGATTPANYSIRGGDEGKARLDVLADALRSTTAALLTRVGVPEGGRCVDLGCGGGHVSRELARQVGPAGVVVAIDQDQRIVELAREDAAAEGLHNIEFRVGDAATFEVEEADVVFTRLLLCHLPDPAALVRRAVASLRSGGVLVVEEPEFDACFSWPPNETYDRSMALQGGVIRRRGGDPDLGPKLAAMLLDVGLRDVGVHVFQPAFLEAPSKDIPVISMEKMADAIIDEGLETAEGVRGLIERLRAFSSHPRSLLAYPRFFQVWGRR